MTNEDEALARDRVVHPLLNILRMELEIAKRDLPVAEARSLLSRRTLRQIAAGNYSYAERLDLWEILRALSGLGRSIGISVCAGPRPATGRVRVLVQADVSDLEPGR